MSTPTAGQLAIMRRPNQSTDLYLAVYQPVVVEYGRVFPDAQIQGLPSDLADNYYIAGFTATNVFTSGTVRNGMTLVFGSAEGKEDLGRTFVRGKSGTHYDFSVLENMPLVSGIYFRVYDYFELWPVFPRVTVDGNNVITYYKDYDEAYNGQNSNFLPVAVVGPNSAAFVDDTSGQKTMTFVATGSYTVDGTAISNAYWEITRNANTLATLTGTTVSYTFPNSGYYTIETRVVNANGLTGTAHRHYILYNREGIVKSIYNPPLRDWKFEGLDGNWDAGGWQCKFSMGDNSDTVRDGALIVIFAEDIYGGGAPQSLGGYADRENILFSGYIDKVDNKNDWQGSRATFSAKSAINLLQNRDMFSVSLETSPNPVDWTQIKNMTINRIIDHYLRWHSTFLDVCDYRLIEHSSGAFPEQYEDIPRGELFGNVRNILSNRLLANFVSDKQGRVFSEIGLNYIITGSRPNPAIVFQESDWIDKLRTIEDLEYKTSSVLLGGVNYDQATTTGSAYLSRAPDALFPLHFGKAETKSGMTIDSQSTLNTLSGLYLAANNARFPSLSMTLANNMRTIDIVPQEFYQLPTDYPFTDRDLRNLKYVWANKRFIPRRINFSLEDFTLQQEIVYETETSGLAGETVRIPAQPPTNGTPEPPTPPGIISGDPPPGLGELEWEVTGVVATAYSIAAYGDYIYVCGGASWRIEKRRKSDGGLEWTYLYPSGTSSIGYDVYVDADGIFSCGYAIQGAPLFTTLKITDTPTTDWIKILPDLGDDSQARGITKISSYIFVAGTHPQVGVQEGVIIKYLASDGSSAGSYILGAGGGSYYDIDSDTEIYAAGPSVRNLDSSLSSHWVDGITSLYAIRLNGSYNYSYQPNHVADTITVQKLVNSDGSTVWESSLPISAFTTIFPSKMDVGDNFVFMPSGIPNDNKIYELYKSNGNSLTGFTTFSTPVAVLLDGNSIYIAGNDGGLWTVQKRTLAYT